MKKIKNLKKDSALVDELEILQKTEELNRDKLFENFNNVYDFDDNKEFNQFLNSKNIIKDIKSKAGKNFFNDNKVLGDIDGDKYYKKHAKLYSERFLKMQEITKDFNKSLDKINNYSTFDLLKTLIKYKVIPEFIDMPDVLKGDTVLNSDNSNNQKLSYLFDDYNQDDSYEEVCNSNKDIPDYQKLTKYSTFQLYKIYFEKYFSILADETKEIKEIILNLEYGSECFVNNNEIKIEDIFALFNTNFKNEFITHLNFTNEKFKILGKYDVSKEFERILPGNSFDYRGILLLDVYDKEYDEVYTQFVINLTDVDIDQEELKKLSDSCNIQILTVSGDNFYFVIKSDAEIEVKLKDMIIGTIDENSYYMYTDLTQGDIQKIKR